MENHDDINETKIDDNRITERIVARYEGKLRTNILMIRNRV